MSHISPNVIKPVRIGLFLHVDSDGPHVTWAKTLPRKFIGEKLPLLKVLALTKSFLAFTKSFSRVIIDESRDFYEHFLSVITLLLQTRFGYH